MSAFLFTYDLSGNQTGALGRFFDLWIDRRFNGPEELHAVIPADDWKADLIVEDGQVRYGDSVWYADTVTDERAEGRLVKHLVALPLWNRLADSAIVGLIELEGMTSQEGVVAILAAGDGAASGWSMEPDPVASPGTFSYEVTDATVLAALRSWAGVTGTTLKFDTLNRQVRAASATGAERSAGFRYGRNVRTVKRTMRPPACTRLYAYGADGLSIAGVNGGNAYLEDLTWYTALGVDLSTARANYVKSRTFEDVGIVDEATLLARAQTVLAGQSQGVLAYEMTVADLRDQLGIIEPYEIGDIVRVADAPLSVDVRTTVVRTVQYPLQPARSTVELAYLLPTRPQIPSGSSTGGGNRQWLLFGHTNSAEYMLRNDGTYIVNRIPLRFREGGEATYHHQLRFVGVGAGSLSVSAVDGTAGELLAPVQVIPYTDGEVHDVVLYSLWRQELNGRQDVRIRAQAVADGGPSAGAGVDIAAGSSRLHVMTYAAVRETAAAANSQRFDYVSDAAQRFTVPDNITIITVTVVGAAGGASANGQPGGRGGSVRWSMEVVPGTEYDVYAPEAGGANADTGNPANNGWPGGALGGTGASGRTGGGGGGYAAFVQAGSPLTAALAVAGGGGGAGDGTNTSGGGGGYTEGEAGTSPNQASLSGGGGTQSAGGAAGASSNGVAVAGSAFQGGEGARQGGGSPLGTHGGGGGGGGWYGGGGGGSSAANEGGSGGGGSSYLASFPAFDIAFESDVQSGNGYVLVEWESVE